MASLDVSGDADYGQGVDARQAEKQSEETVYLEENGEGGSRVIAPELQGNPCLSTHTPVALGLC